MERFAEEKTEGIFGLLKSGLILLDSKWNTGIARSLCATGFRRGYATSHLEKGRQARSNADPDLLLYVLYKTLRS